MLTWGGANDLSQPSFANVTMLGWCRVPRECLNDLSRQPVRRRMSGYREPQQLPPAMADDGECKQALERQCGNHAEIDRRDGFRMIAQESTPALRSRFSAFVHVLGISEAATPRRDPAQADARPTRHRGRPAREGFHGFRSRRGVRHRALLSAPRHAPSTADER